MNDGSINDVIRSADPGVLTVWSDIGCPWASLALHTLHAAAEQRGVALVIDHRAFPLELFNRRGTPKLIIDVEVYAIAGLRKELGWRPWTASDSTYPVAMLPAMAAVQAAKSEHVGGLTASDELDSALRRAFYADCRCISIHTEIIDIAAECPSVDEDALDHALRQGAGWADVYAQWNTAQRPEISGSPHLFVGAGDTAGLHNPGVAYHWTAPPDDGGVVRFERYEPGWADAVLTSMGRAPRSTEPETTCT